MHDHIAILHGRLQRLAIEYIALNDAKARTIVEASGGQSVAPEVIEHDYIVVVEQALNKMGADEASATGD